MSPATLFSSPVPLRIRLVWTPLALVLLGFGGPAWSEGPGEEPRPQVQAVEIRTSMPGSGIREVRRLVSIPVGQPLSSDDVRRTLRNLQASGRVSEAEVWTRPVANGVAVSVAIWGATLVDSVKLVGELGLRKRDLERVIEQRAGQPLVEDRVVRSVFALQGLYEREGYDRARVRVAVEQDDTGHEAQVVFNVEPGVRRRIASLNFQGVGKLDDVEVREAFGLDIGNAYRERTVREASESLGAWLRERGYLASDVTVLPVKKEADGNANLVVQVSLGPEYRFDISGWDAKKIQKAGLLPSTGWDPNDDFFLDQTQSRILNFLQMKGHYRALVEVHSESLKEEEGVLRVVVDIVPGPVYRLVETDFEGNESFSDERLEDLMTTSAKNSLVIGSGRLVDDVLTADLTRVRSFYALSGYPEVSVGPAEILDRFENAPETPPEKEQNAVPLRLLIPVEEGRQTRVVNLEWVGVEAIGLEALRGGLPLTPGGPYHPQRLDEALDLVRSRYEAKGYAKVLVSAETDWNEELTLVDVTLRIQEGEQQRLGRVIIRGNQRLETRVIRGLAGFKADEPLSQGRLFKAQLALYRLGVFSRVSVSLAPGGDESALRDVVIRVVEGDAQRTSYGVGYDSEEGLGGLFGYSHRNLWGRGLRFQV
ncbi:MAG: hypothetical protein K8J08_06795, partial [Thermoanaerobaculia bacterium]|nr:hypothetical protein [Thermoanaerobaculia bacterium]